jgi:hypothetical protein
MDTAKIRVIFECEFRRRCNAAETACNINVAFAQGSSNDLREMVEAHPNQTAQELAAWYTNEIRKMGAT